MNNDMKLYSSTNFSEEAAEDMRKLRNALRLIAKEILRFRLEDEAGKRTICKNYRDTDVLEKENTCSAKLHTKNKQVKKLKENLNIMCNVAKIVLSAKNRDREHLMGQLNEMQNETLEIRKGNTQNVSLIYKLRTENCNINNDMQLLCNFIHLAYEKLQKMRIETPTYLPCAEKLKAVLLACEQYYADYSNARDRCALLERKNRFLKNKLIIVENNLIATTEELRNLRSQNTKLRIKRDLNYKDRETKAEILTSPNISDMFLDKLLDGGGSHFDNAITKTIQNKLTQKISNRSLYVTSHLETVSNLILDQDNMLRELKELDLEALKPE